jgi:hypothetical protein
MGAEMSARQEPRVGRCRRSGQLAGLGLLLALGCFTQKRPGDSAPSTAPVAPTPAAATPPAPPAPLEEESEAPADARDAAPRRDAEPRPTAAPPASSSALAPEKTAVAKKPAAKARGARPKAEPERGDADRDEVVGGIVAEPPSARLRHRLDRAYGAGTPDCPSARERKKAVCDLAAQICQLIDRDPNVASVAEHCADAKERCAEAERRTEERCPE